MEQGADTYVLHFGNGRQLGAAHSKTASASTCNHYSWLYFISISYLKKLTRVSLIPCIMAVNIRVLPPKMDSSAVTTVYNLKHASSTENIFSWCTALLLSSRMTHDERERHTSSR